MGSSLRIPDDPTSPRLKDGENEEKPWENEGSTRPLKPRVEPKVNANWSVNTGDETTDLERSLTVVERTARKLAIRGVACASCGQESKLASG
jgi:hypothetical protein